MGNSKTHYYASSEIMFLSADDASCEDAAYKLLTAFDKHIISNDGYVFSGFISEKRNNEVLVGYIPEREVSLRAYEKLNDVKSSSGITESRYLIYAEDGTIAVAYDRNPYTAAEAIGDIIDLFIEKYVNGIQYTYDIGLEFYSPTGINIQPNSPALMQMIKKYALYYFEKYSFTEVDQNYVAEGYGPGSCLITATEQTFVEGVENILNK